MILTVGKFFSEHNMKQTSVENKDETCIFYLTV